MNEIDGICTIYPVFFPLSKTVSLVSQTVVPRVLVWTINQTVNSLFCAVWSEDVISLVLKHVLCCQILYSNVLKTCAMSSQYTT